jgi:hypothetical protein
MGKVIGFAIMLVGLTIGLNTGIGAGFITGFGAGVDFLGVAMDFAGFFTVFHPGLVL